MNEAQRAAWGFLQCSLQNVIEQDDLPILREFLAEDLARYEAATATAG